jgi:hypothetical protein
MSNFTLYTITNDYIQAINKLLESDIATDDSCLVDIKDSFDQKCINVVKYIKCLEAEYDGIKKEADRMTDRAKRVSKHIASLSEYLKSNIEKTGLLDSIKSPEFEIKLATNPASLVIFDPDLIPDIYKVTEQVTKIDKALLKNDIKDGFEVEGAKLSQSKRLVIK